MAVTSRDIDTDGKPLEAEKPRRPARGGGDWSMTLLRVAGWLCVIAFGGLFWLVNGSFSVVGLRVIALQVGDGGVLFWRAVSAWHTTYSADTIGQQPIVPWLGVIAASLFQVAIIVRSIQRKPVPVWAYILGTILSVYDFATTFSGFGTLQWVTSAGPLAQIPLTILFTFGLESLIGYLLRRK